MKRHYVQLKEVTESWLQNFADKMYSGDVMGRDVHKSPTFDKIAHEFTCSLIYEDITELEKKCQLFLTIRSSNGGPARMEAAALAKDWEQEVLIKHNIKWTLTHKEHEAELNPEIEVNTEDEIAIKLGALKKKFSSLATDIREYYHNSKQYEVIRVARFMSEYLNDQVHYTNLATIDSIFDAAGAHYDFLNCELIIDLIDELPLNDDLQSKFRQYVKELEDFYNSTELQQIENKIRKAVQPKEELRQLTCDVVIKVTGVYSKKTIAHLKILLKYILGEESKLLKLIEIRKGSLTLVFLAPSSLEQTFILKIKAIQQYIHYLGVFQITINGQTIIDRAEFFNFTLEESLVYTIVSIHKSTAKVAEFERLAFLLMQFDININYKNEKGFGFLYLASEIGHYRLVEALLDKDPDINIQDDDAGWTPLMAASAEGKYQVVELLLSKNPKINIQSKDGWTALMLACRSRHQNTAAILLSKNPDISIQNERFGVTALMMASAIGLPVVETILNRAKPSDINICDNKGMTPLMMACQQGHYQTVRLILSKNPDLNIRNNVAGWTALMLASSKGHHQIVELLLSNDPDINIKSFDGMTALMLATNEGQIQVITSLLKKDPDMNVQGYDGATALMRASFKGYHQVVELLLSKDQNINIQGNNGATSLIVASSNGHHQVVELLLSKDPDVNIKDGNGFTALIIACAKGHHRVVEALLRNDPDLNAQDKDSCTALIVACMLNHHKIVTLLLNENPNINIQDNNGWTALMTASNLGLYQVVELLLNKDPDVNIQSNDGWTALMLACQEGHDQVVELILSKNPDCNIQNKYGLTALMLACENGQEQVIKLLLSKGVDANIQDNDGWSALIHACQRGYHQIISLLLSENVDVEIPSKDGTKALTSILLFSKLMIEKIAKKCSGWASLNLLLMDHLKSLELLLNCHPNHMHILDGMELHSLAVAAWANNLEAVEILLKKCDITPENISSAFTSACYQGHSSIMIHLSEKITTLSDNERKLLVATAEGDLGTLISMIYEVGMSPDTPLVAGITPLMIAATSGHIELVDTLIQAGADVSKSDIEGNTALDVTKNIQLYDRKDIIALLPDITTADVDMPVSAVEKKEKKKIFITIPLESFFSRFKSVLMRAYNPAAQKRKERASMTSFRASMTSFGTNNAQMWVQ